MDRADQFRSDSGVDRRAVLGRAGLKAAPRDVDASAGRGTKSAVADALVVGAGPAGLAAAYELKRAGVPPRVLDGANEIGSSWRARHQQLHLNTYRALSHQPGMKIPVSAGMFPSRDDYIAYLEHYVAFLDVPIEYGTWVRRQLEDGITLAVDNGFVAALRAGRFKVVPEIERFTRNAVHPTNGQTIHPDSVICATGYRLGLEELVGHLDVLDKRGRPRWIADRSSPTYPGPWFLGQNSSLYGNMNIRRGEARRLARLISRDLRTPAELVGRAPG